VLLLSHSVGNIMMVIAKQLIATRYLKDLFQLSPLPPSVQQSAVTSITSRRSPLLTNGHNLGGSYELGWEEGMPIGDVFVSFMKRSWAIQQHQRRENISPRRVLNCSQWAFNPDSLPYPLQGPFNSTRAEVRSIS